MSDNDLIRRGDALALCDRYPYVEGVRDALVALPAVTAPDPAAIREAALREAAEASPNRAYRVGYAAGRAAGLREAAAIIGEMVEGALTVQAQEHAIQCQEAVLAPITKGDDGRRVYMGQIMAECDCPREAECQAAGRCIAEGRR